MKKEHLKVFLSYGSEDEPVVRDIYQRLREEGINPWFDRESLGVITISGVQHRR